MKYERKDLSNDKLKELADEVKSNCDRSPTYNEWLQNTNTWRNDKYDLQVDQDGIFGNSHFTSSSNEQRDARQPLGEGTRRITSKKKTSST